MIVDTHAHLNDSRYFDDIDSVIERAKKSGVTRYIIPGADPSELSRAFELSKSYSEIYYTIGVHPYDKAKYNKEHLLEFAQDSKCVGVGECGLDYYRLPNDEFQREADIVEQKMIFREQIQLAKELKLPLVVHIRNASADAKEILLEQGASEVGGVLHCYNADEQLLMLSEKNFYFGIGGVLTFKNAKKLAEVLPKIPKDKLLIETDAPYLTPHPHRGERNEPAYTALVADKMASILNMNRTDIEELTTKNAYALFSKMK